MLYDAFLSYSHAADGKLAPSLQSGLQQFAKPWNRLRAIRVFRDKTGVRRFLVAGGPGGQESPDRTRRWRPADGALP